ncbi:MAG: filamentous hemagglutinin N-terminal domain-containing protein [Proteobacteria bacterium]|nr:filamentous hemagglutinin N-terminal domain-containing protein [Pseudomonadota bacterium]
MNVRPYRLRPIAEFLRRSISSPIGWGALASIPGLALAGPSGENVVGGAAVINRPNATHTLIDQSTQNAIVNWQSFSVNSEEYVIFNQPGTTSSILNRVVGSQQSTILGQIQANGRVFLVNPQGILFGQGSKVDVGSLAASTLDISDNDFMSGKYVFARSSEAVDGASVENAGDIKVADGGYVVLAGDYASNSGVVTARLGSVVLAAGNKMTLDLSDDGLVSFAVDEATVSALAGANNSGQVLADGGQIIMTAKVANDLVATAVNNDGLLQAHRIVEDGGEIYLSASGGNIEQSGVIDVAAESNHAGGTVEIIGDKNITLTAGSEINANGAGTGNGGVVNVIADGTLAVQRDSDINAIAGASGSKGGAVEVSGHGSLKLKGDVTVGAGGEIVIDPAILRLSASNSSGNGSSVGTQWIEGQLDAGAGVTLRATDEINAAAGGMAIVSLGFGALTLQIGYSGGAPDPTGNINLAGFEIDINGSFTALAGTVIGDVNLGKVSARNVIIAAGATGGSVTLNTGGITTNDGDISVEALGGAVTIGTTVLPGHVTASDASASIIMNAALGLTVNGSVTADGANRLGFVSFGAVNDIVVTGSVTALGSDARVNLNAGNDILVTNDLTASGSNDASVNATAGRHLNLRHATAWTSGGFSGSFNGDASINLIAANNITATGDLLASASGGGSYGGGLISATINATAQNIAARDVTAYSGRNIAQVNVTASNNINVRNVEAEIGTTASSGLGDARVDLSAGNNIVANNIEALGGTSFGFARVNLTAGNNITVNDVTAIASGCCDDASIDFSAGNNIIAHNVMAISSNSDASISFDAFNDITVNDVTAIASGNSVFIDFIAGRNLRVNGVTTGVALEEFSISYSAGNTVAINGAINATVLGDSYVEIEIVGDNGVTINAPINAIAMAGASASIFVDASSGNVAINGALTSRSVGNRATISIFADGALAISGPSVVSGSSAIFGLSAGAINVTGSVTVTAQSNAQFSASATNDLTVLGDVVISEVGGGFAGVNYEFGNNGVFAHQSVTAGPGGTAFAGFGIGQVNGNTATFMEPVVVRGGSFGGIGAGVKNAIRTVKTGLLDADDVSLLVTNNGTTAIDVKTKARVVRIQNIGLTPNVRLDNRAFFGPSVVDFGSGGTMLKSTSLLATGSLTVRGPFLADNLAIGVTDGSVTFLDSVFITGNNPFLPTAPDLALFRILGLNNIAAPGHGPNVKILASKGISITRPFVVGGANPFTKMFSNGPINVSGLTGNGDNFLAVFSPTNLAQNIVFNNFPSSLPVIPALGTTTFSAFPTFSGLPNTTSSTVVIGELGPGGIPLLNGNLDIASRGGTIDFGNKNLFFITKGNVTGGVDDVSTTGIVDIIGLAQANFFVVPLVQDVTDDDSGDEDDDDDDEDEDLALGDDDGGDDDGEVTEESDSSAMECSA